MKLVRVGPSLATLPFLVLVFRDLLWHSVILVAFFVFLSAMVWASGVRARQRGGDIVICSVDLSWSVPLLGAYWDWPTARFLQARRCIIDMEKIRPDSGRESFNIGPPAGLRPAGGPILRLPG